MGKKHIGQSSFGGDGAKSFSSNNSAIFFLQAPLCCDRCSFWHLILQYRTRVQAHFFNLISPLRVLPQEAHDVSPVVSELILISYSHHKEEKNVKQAFTRLPTAATYQACPRLFHAPAG
mmetsp:Transcript_26653/g.38090  ORF Transcript_26653/g.38090 Transcript_26653/m.38090 type:complete len:119 (-) Transcript_26653:39-395(-)